MTILRRRRAALLQIGLALGGSGAALAQPRHWLIGTWHGEVIGLREANNTRTLRVTAVAPDGTVTATWAGQAVEARLVGEELRLTTGANNPVVLSRGPDGGLSGFLTLRSGGGPRHSVLMQRR